MYDFPCHECGSEIRPQRMEHKVNFRGIHFLVPDALIGVCTKCGTQHFEGKEYDRWEKLFEKSLTERQKPLSPLEIKALRQRLGLNQRQFSVLLGCSRQSIYNWENPKRRKPQERQADLMIRLLAEPEALEFLLNRAQEIGVMLPRPSIPARAASANSPVRVRPARRLVPVTA